MVCGFVVGIRNQFFLLFYFFYLIIIIIITTIVVIFIIKGGSSSSTIILLLLLSNIVSVILCLLLLFFLLLLLLLMLLGDDGIIGVVLNASFSTDLVLLLLSVWELMSMLLLFTCILGTIKGQCGFRLSFNSFSASLNSNQRERNFDYSVDDDLFTSSHCCCRCSCCCGWCCFTPLSYM